MWVILTKSFDSFGTLHVVFCNTETLEQIRDHFDEGSHSDCEQRLKTLNENQKDKKHE